MINGEHNHDLMVGEALAHLRPMTGMKEKFIPYFESGKGTTEACSHHAEINNLTEVERMNGRTNPSPRVVKNWYNEWRTGKFGPRLGDGVSQV